ncbi:hypothetical protein D3C78_1823140 [compost metagenome]
MNKFPIVVAVVAALAFLWLLKPRGQASGGRGRAEPADSVAEHLHAPLRTGCSPAPSAAAGMRW